MVTGLSLGAALATHCAADLVYNNYTNFTFYNFGCPRVIKQIFFNIINLKFLNNL